MSPRDVPHRLAVVILNYRTPDDTIRTVGVLQAEGLPASAIVVVDNASGDGSAERFARELPGVPLIVAESNGGFSAGCNLGIRHVLDGGVAEVLLLNPDVVIHARAIATLQSALESDPLLGIVGPMLVSGDNVQSAGMFYSGTTGRMRHLGYGTAVGAMPPFHVRDVDGLSGCAMLIRRDTLERVGLLKEEFFFGFEDLEFCLRARDNGIRTACVGEAVAQHGGNASIGRRSPRRIYFATRNHLMLSASRSSHGSLAGRGLRTTWILALNIAYALLRADVSRIAGLRAFTRGARDHFAGRYGLPPPDL